MSDRISRPAARVPVYLVRHGLTPWNRDGLVQGWTDIPLSEGGRDQARRLAAALSSVTFARVLTSTLCRARETAEIIMAGRDIRVEAHEDLREYGCGRWEGRPFLEVRATEAEAFRAWFSDAEVPMPEGESMAGAARRAMPVVDRALLELPADSGALLVVAHGGVNRLIAAHLLGEGIEFARRLRLDNASLSIFEPFLGGFALRLWNSTAHLENGPESGSSME